MRTTRWLSVVVLVGLVGVLSPAVARSELLVGASTADITPPLPVALDGQFRLRIARTAETPLTANALVLQVQDEKGPGDCAVFVSCDVLYIPNDVLKLVRQELQKRVPELDPKKVVLNGTHTHTAPVLVLDKYPIPTDGVTQVESYRQLFAERVAQAVADAWKKRAVGRVSWGLSHAVVGYNRRAVYADGTARMYGRTDVASFRHLEGYEDHDVDCLFVWNAEGKLLAVAVNVACPAQEVESRSAVNADFWHPVRERLRQRFGKQLVVLGWAGAAGDQSPHLMYRRAAEERMRKLRGLTRLEEIARRIVRAVEDAYEVVRNDQHTSVVLRHHVETLRLPSRRVTKAEYDEAKAACAKLAAKMEKDPKARAALLRRFKWYELTVQRYERQQREASPTYEMELHVVRVGDAAVCTNSFELFTDYGIRIKARSPAVQTFLIQLAGPGTYLPTARAVKGGGYSAVVHSSLVGPEGGQRLVDRTVEVLQTLWAAPAKKP